MAFFLLINLKLLTTANSFLLIIAEHEHFSANKYEQIKFHAQMSRARKNIVQPGGPENLLISAQYRVSSVADFEKEVLRYLYFFLGNFTKISYIFVS